MEIVIGMLGFFVAAWQLNLQRKEIRRNGKINTLVHMSMLLKDQIGFYAKIIESKKETNQPWQGHAKVVNDELRPLLNTINKDLIKITSEYRCSFDHIEVIKALRLTAEAEGSASATLQRAALAHEEKF